MSILNHVPSGYTLRDVQHWALLDVEQAWHKSDVIVMNLPVAAGKSLCAKIIAKFAASEHGLRSAIITPTKLLSEQYVRDYGIVTLRGKDDDLYKCTDPKPPKGRQRKEQPCGECDNCKRMPQDKIDVGTSDYFACNYWVYFANRLWRDVLIVDEAHLLLKLLNELNATRFWQSEHKFPNNIQSLGDLLSWAEGNPVRYERLIQELTELKMSSIPSIEWDYNKRKHLNEPCLKMLPLDSRNRTPWFWPGRQVKKIILMSATIHPQDIVDLGLERRRTTYVHCDSPIPRDRRQVLYMPVGDMGHKHQEETLPELAQALDQIADTHRGEKGLVHATYSVAEQLADLIDNPRFMFHDKETKAAQYQAFRDSEDGILVASGMHEGIDLAGDYGRWQVITQVPYPSLECHAIAHRLKEEPDWYAWQTVRSILQATGRICRTPEDYGVTYILDVQFERLMRRYRSMFPEYYIESIRRLDKTAWDGLL